MPDCQTPLLRPCAQADLPAILALQDAVYDRLPTPSLFARTSHADFVESLRLDVCRGVFDAHGRLLAYGHCVVNRETDRSLGLLDGEPAVHCLSIDTVFVDPGSRGHGFQCRLMRAMLADGARPGARYAYATIAPDNTPSLRNAQAEGFTTRRQVTCYGGLTHLLLRRPLSAPGVPAPANLSHKESFHV